MQKLSKTLKLPTYGSQVIILITDVISTEINSLYKKHKVNNVFEGEAEGAVVTIDIDKYYLLLSSAYLSHNTIAHEVFHGAVRITEDRGIVDEEAQAWLAGHITGVIYKFLEQKNLSVKHG